MSTDTVLKAEKVIDIVRNSAPDDPLGLARAIEQAVLQSPEVQALRKDAERYRWLQDRYKDVPGMIDSGAIDAAMEKQT